MDTSFSSDRNSSYSGFPQPKAPNARFGHDAPPSEPHPLERLERFRNTTPEEMDHLTPDAVEEILFFHGAAMSEMALAFHLTLVAADLLAYYSTEIDDALSIGHRLLLRSENWEDEKLFHVENRVKQWEIGMLPRFATSPTAD